ncbi:MAG: hypothetical protein AAGB02_05040 [Pseudomonadota bacterium]
MTAEKNLSVKQMFQLLSRADEAACRLASQLTDRDLSELANYGFRLNGVANGEWHRREHLEREKSRRRF